MTLCSSRTARECTRGCGIQVAAGLFAAAARISKNKEPDRSGGVRCGDPRNKVNRMTGSALVPLLSIGAGRWPRRSEEKGQHGWTEAGKREVVWGWLSIRQSGYTIAFTVRLVGELLAIPLTLVGSLKKISEDQN